ncbi:unnamed protein product [Lactuca saligna]|uniref:Uncharacterized protein n=1 Tax=Lactuca saligna TaxID=75948 RepID=A0AA35ZWD8_LACSI|nr:unnamed protein product [Lactuca saligna]
MDDPPLKIDGAKDVPVSIHIWDDPKPDYEDVDYEEIMFQDDNIIVGAIPHPLTFNLLQKPSSSKVYFEFRLSSSLDEMKEEENQEANNNTPPNERPKVNGDLGT